MDQPINSFGAIIKRPSAFLPLAMSLTALAMLGGAYIFGLATGHGGLYASQMRGRLHIYGSYSWRGSYPYWHSSRSSGCHELQGRPCVYLRCKLEPRSHQWPPSFFSIYEWEFLRIRLG